MTLNDLYLRVAEICLEPGGFQLGLITDQQFLSAYVDVVSQFLQETRAFQLFTCMNETIGQEEWELPDWCGDVRAAFHDNNYLRHENSESLGATNEYWSNSSTRLGVPQMWREDTMDPKGMAVWPFPLRNGNQVSWPVNGFLGTIASITASPSDSITAVFPAPFYGTLAGTVNDYDPVYYGSTYVDTPGVYVGTVSGMNEAKTDLMAVSTAVLKNRDVALSPPLTGFIEYLHDTFADYIVYGILEKLWSADSESRDVFRAQYCRRRYQEGVKLVAYILGSEVEAGENRQR